MNYNITNLDEFNQFVIDEEIDLTVSCPPPARDQIDKILTSYGKFLPKVQIQVRSHKNDRIRIIMFVLTLEELT